MTVEFLIHAIVHQTTVLIAQLATLGGARAPLAQVANQVFVELARELERQGVSRKVSADMFGLGLRTYRRKIQRLSESSTERGRSLWEVVLEFIKGRPSTTKHEVLLRFSLDDEAQVRAVLRDLCDNQLVVAEGGLRTTFRAASDDELLALRSNQATVGQDDMLVALMYREGPLRLDEIAQRAQTDASAIEVAIERLVSEGRVQCTTERDVPRYEARALVIPLGAAIGWEAAVLDHFKAVVKTILVRLNNQGITSLQDEVGGSTYTIDIWPGHPMSEEVRGTLKQVRSLLGGLRQRVNDYNDGRVRPPDYTRVVVYTGQCLIAEEAGEEVVGGPEVSLPSDPDNPEASPASDWENSDPDNPEARPASDPEN